MFHSFCSNRYRFRSGAPLLITRARFNRAPATLAIGNKLFPRDGLNQWKFSVLSKNEKKNDFSGPLKQELACEQALMGAAARVAKPKETSRRAKRVGEEVGTRNESPCRLSLNTLNTANKARSPTNAVF